MIEYRMVILVRPQSQTFAEAFNRLAGVMFVWYRKIRIAGDGLAATRAPEAHQCAKDRFDKHINDNQKTPFAVCMQFEK